MYGRCQRIVAYTSDGSNINDAIVSAFFSTPAVATVSTNPDAQYSFQFNMQGRKFSHQHILTIFKDLTMVWQPQVFDGLKQVYATDFTLERKFDPTLPGIEVDMEVDDWDSLPLYRMRIFDTQTLKVLAKKAWVVPPDFSDQIINVSFILAGTDRGEAVFTSCDADYSLYMGQGGMKVLQIGAVDEPVYYTLSDGTTWSGFTSAEGSNLYQRVEYLNDTTLAAKTAIGPYVGML